ncbi:MAG: hypothetical protein ACFFCW_06780 [Candidatus Hodarchaeota archaeon]
MNKLWKIFFHHEVVNFLNGTDGSKYKFNLEDFNEFRNVIAHAVCNDQENLGIS